GGLTTVRQDLDRSHHGGHGRRSDGHERPADRPRRSDSPFSSAGPQSTRSRSTGSGVGASGSASLGATSRCIQRTSCHAPALKPIFPKTPMVVKPSPEWSATLAGFGSVIPAYALQNPCSRSSSNSDV